MLKYYGAEICKDCVAARALLAQRGIEAELIDITASTANLRAFLALRDSRPEFDSVKAEGRIGIPAFILDDGSIVLGSGWLQSGPACTDC